MPLIDYVSPDEVDIDLDSRYEKRSLYTEIRLNNPAVLRAQRAYGAALFEAGPVDETLYEYVMVAVAQANECDYCAASHRENLIDILGLDREEVARIAEGNYSELGNRERSVTEFAEKVARDPHRVTAEDIDGLHSVGFDDSGVIQLLAVIGFCDTANKTVSALDVNPSDREGLPNTDPEDSAGIT